MSYIAKSNGDGSYEVSSGGIVIPDAKVKRISFATNTGHTQQGQVHYIEGDCSATIFVPGIGNVRKVPVVF